MISKNKLKYYTSLKVKKYRTAERKFIVEGLRIVKELIKSPYEIELILVTKNFLEREKGFVQTLEKDSTPLEIISEKEFKKLAETETPQGILAVALMPSEKEDTEVKGNIVVALDDISEPGNLGTILRTCNWFGIKDVLLSPQTVELYNPKVLRASMGAVFYLNVKTLHLRPELLRLKEEGYAIIVADMKGKNVFDFTPVPQKAVLVFSNEARGVSEEIRKTANEILTIPKFGDVESLNVAAATAIIIAEFKKRTSHSL